MKKLYIFDFDGTLVNTFYDSVISYNQALKEHNLPEYEYESLDQIDYTDFVDNMTDNMTVLETYSKIYENSEKEHTLPYNGITTVLEELINDLNGKPTIKRRTTCLDCIRIILMDIQQSLQHFTPTILLRMIGPFALNLKVIVQ